MIFNVEERNEKNPRYSGGKQFQEKAGIWKLEYKIFGPTEFDKSEFNGKLYRKLFWFINAKIKIQFIIGQCKGNL